MILDAGIEEERITLIASLGAHRPMVRQDLVKKCGQEVVDRFRILNHHPFENLVDVGQSSRGTPIRINRDFWKADLKIGVGSITPHSYAGFGGGGKIVLPGISGIETLEANHGPVWQGLKCKLADVDQNPCREDIEEIATKIGLNMVADVVSGPSREVAGVFAGDPISAHRQGVHYALQTYRTEVPADLDIAILNAYPKDTDVLQTPNVFNLPLSMDRRLVRKGGALVVVSACTEGAGFHGLEGYGMRLYGQIDTADLYQPVVEDSQLFLFSPNVNVYDVGQYYSERVTFCNRWDDLIQRLKEIYHGAVRVGVVPCASLQIARE
jgi:nickel-dependent lactate racemase